MTNNFPPMRDEAAIPHLTRTVQRDGAVCYFFGDTTIRAVETQAAGEIHLTPVAGNQAACGEWVDFDTVQVRWYCELLVRHRNSGEPGGMGVS